MERKISTGEKRNRAGKNIGGNRGMTLAEMLIVIAIIGVLAGVAFIAVWNYLRSLAQIERDGIAREIFVAAQNHLTAARGEGYLGRIENKDGMTQDEKDGIFGYSEGAQEVYYFVYSPNAGTYTDSQSTVLDLMLPFGSIDETVRAGGSYIIRYQYDTGLVLDVFYCSMKGSPKVFNHELTKEEYTDVNNLKGEEHRAGRKKYANKGKNSVLGWYGGTESASLPSLTLGIPTIKVTNAERLYVTITDPNSDKAGAALRLIITGETSRHSRYIDVYTSSAGRDSTKNSWEIELDNITEGASHFQGLSFSDGKTGEELIPGENITLKAVAYSTSALANIMYSNEATTNSLFADGTTANSLLADGTTAAGTAYIENFRHLENLDKKISHLDDNDSGNALNIGKAVQRKDLDWSSDDSGYWTLNKIKPLDGNAVTLGKYCPIEPDYALEYDGDRHRIQNIAASGENAGLFGNVAPAEGTVISVRNLELIDFHITGTSTAGALAGSLNGVEVTNVLARNTDNVKVTSNTDKRWITAPEAGGLAGGLIGKITGGKVQYSAASLVVNGSGTAGGLIGTAEGTDITGCYAGGHTQEGSYEKWVETAGRSYDVTGGTAGGLVGSYTGASEKSISSSYSTCSVSGSSKAGGFIGDGKVKAGDTSGGTISKCYAAGLVETGLISEDGEKAANKGAFAGAMTAGITAVNCNYFGIVSEVKKGSASENAPDHYLGAVGDDIRTGIEALDLSAEDYNTFVGDPDDWNDALAYDPVLMKYYGGKYSLKSVEDCDTSVLLPEGYTWSTLYVNIHYGDWPAPEVFVINTR